MHSIKKIKYIKDYILELTFDDNSKKAINFKPRIDRLSLYDDSIFKQLQNVEYFKSVKLNPDIETICWPNNADFCPDVLYDEKEEVNL